MTEETKTDPQEPANNPPPSDQQSQTETKTETKTDADWKAALPEDLRVHPSLKDIKDLSALANSFVNGQKLIGADRATLVQVPGPDADDATKNDFYSKLGRPENADGYELPVDEKMFSDGFKRNEEMEKWFKDEAHKAGLSTTQAKALYGSFINYSKGVFDQTSTEIKQARDNAISSLKTEWGAAYESQINRAKGVVNEFMDDDMKNFLASSGLGDHPTFIKTMAALGKALGEDTIGEKSKSENVMTPGEANAAIAAKRRDTAFMQQYQNGTAPGHAAAVAEMDRLYKMAGGVTP